jgi:molybdopterin synthase sulfur carrier subunit
VKLLYFAWLRTRIGRGEEEIDVPAEVATVADLLGWLEGRGGGYAEALARHDLVRVAVNQEFASAETPVTAGDEVALFPPVTGG